METPCNQDKLSLGVAKIYLLHLDLVFLSLGVANYLFARTRLILHIPHKVQFQLMSPPKVQVSPTGPPAHHSYSHDSPLRKRRIKKLWLNGTQFGLRKLPMPLPVTPLSSSGTMPIAHDGISCSDDRHCALDLVRQPKLSLDRLDHTQHAEGQACPCRVAHSPRGKSALRTQGVDFFSTYTMLSSQGEDTFFQICVPL